MQFDWTTFLLEMINFLVLVWVLKHFFYRPVLNVLDARKASVLAEMERAAKSQQEAESLKQQYEARLADWNKERELSHQQLEQELTQARASGMENIKNSLADEAAKAHVRNAAAVASREAELVRQASGVAYSNAAAMLQRLASAALTERIAQLFLEDLAALPATEQATLRKAGQDLSEGMKVEIAAAHPLDDKVVAEISQSLTLATGQTLHVVFKLVPELIAGLRVSVGECLLQANLADELAFFRSRNGHAG